MDELDKILKQSFTRDVNVPKQCRDAIKNALYVNEEINKERKKNISDSVRRKIIKIVSIGGILIGSVAVAANFNNIWGTFGPGRRSTNCCRSWICCKARYGLCIFK